MKPSTILVLALILSFASLALPVTAASEDYQYLHVNQMQVRFDRTDAVVTVSYDLDFFSEIYVFILGSRNLEPTLKQVFSDFEDVAVVEIGRQHAVFTLRNVSRDSGDYYLHDSHELGTSVDLLKLEYPDGTSKDIAHANATPNTFYKQV